MAFEKSTRRMTLRQQLTHAEKCSRDLIEHFQTTVLPYLTDLRDLSRPVRRRSHYPAMVALINSLKKAQQAGVDTLDMLDYFHTQLQEIHEHARRERLRR
jgi:hypothetical protein